MSTVILDTITGKSTATTITIGSTPVVSASANSMTIRGEGTAQTSIQQGLAKAWINFNGIGTIASRDSFNVSGITDNGTGDYTTTFSNNLSNDDYCATGMCTFQEGSTPRYRIISGYVWATSSIRVITGYTDTTAADHVVVGINIAGDLA